MWTLREASAAAGGRLLGADASFNSVVTDTRRDCSGALFVALRGARFDGHDHVAEAAARGAAAALVDHPMESPLPLWLVEDTRLGLGRLATWGRESATASAAFGDGPRHFEGQGDLVAHLRTALNGDSVVLVKGSRAARMERIVQALCGSPSGTEGR